MTAGRREGDGCVLDASALLALLQGEPGADLVEARVEGSRISTVNWSEVLQKAAEREIDVSRLRQEVEALGVEIVPFTAEHAERAARLRAPTRHLGLSLGDRACLALAGELGLPVIATDRAWARTDLGLEVVLVR